MVKLANVLSRLNPAKILVIGDMILDTYTMGTAKRISPEAPVAVVNVYREEHRPGGAGNVILNLLSLGADVVAIGRVGKDCAGEFFLHALQAEHVDCSMIVHQESYRTPVKNRIISDNQQIVRVDHEQCGGLNELLEKSIMEQLPILLEEVKVVAISDYGKGFLTPTLLSAVFQISLEKGIIVITDPKGHDFAKYKGTTIIKPNLSETFAAANLPSSAPLDLAASIVLKQTEARLLMVTRSEAGISLFENNGARYDFPVQTKEIKDVTGAGDTVLAMFAFALANHLSYEESVQLCNIAAGMAIEHVGCARISLSDLAIRLFENNMGYKLFDFEHLFILQEILKRRTFNLIIISQVSQLNHFLYHAIKKISQESDALLVYLEEGEKCETFVEILASLREVAFILICPDSLRSLCLNVSPKMTYFCDPFHLTSINYLHYIEQNQSCEKMSLN